MIWLTVIMQKRRSPTGSFVAVTRGMRALSALSPVAGKLVPIVGAAFGAINAGVQIYHEAKAGHGWRAGLDGLKASAYAVSAGATVVAATDFWNPTFIAPAAVALGAGALGAAIDSGEAIHDNWNKIIGFAKGIPHWFDPSPHQPLKPHAPTAPPKLSRDPSDFSRLKGGRQALVNLKAQSHSPSKSATGHSLTGASVPSTIKGHQTLASEAPPARRRTVSRQTLHLSMVTSNLGKDGIVISISMGTPLKICRLMLRDFSSQYFSE